jgi:hypothetical protein
VSNRSILIFFQVASLQRQYKELFPYKELSNKFIFQEFGPSGNFLQNTHNLKLNPITRRVHAFLQNSELRRRKYATIFYLDRVNGYYPNKSSLQHIRIRYFEKKNFLEQVFTLVFSNYYGSLFLKKLLNLLFRFESFFKDDLLNHFDVYILPYTGGISVESDFLLWLAKRVKIKSIAIQENWDNLSSKQFLLNFPSVFLVWGSQSGSHLRTYHHYNGDIKEIGCLRLQGLYKQRIAPKVRENRTTFVHEKFRILVIDSGVTNGDLEILRKLSSWFLDSDTLNKKFEVVYRTHPRFNDTDLRKKFIAEVKKLPHIRLFIPDDFESNGSRIQQISESEIIISIFSTYVLEGSILDKICIVPTFAMDYDSFSPKKLIDDITHFHGMSMLNRVKTVTNFDEIITIVENFEDINAKEPNNLVLLDWFCRNVNTKQEIIDSIHDTE